MHFTLNSCYVCYVGTAWSSWNQMIKLFEWGDVFVQPGDTFNLLVAQVSSLTLYETLTKIFL